MLLSLRKNGLTSLFKEVKVFKGVRGARNGAGAGLLLKIPGGGGSFRRGGEGEGPEGVCEEFGGGGGLNFFFRGRNSHQD